MESNVPGYRKNKATGIVINNNTSELSTYKKQKQAVLDKKALELRVKELEKELADQKTMLQEILLNVGILKAGI